MTLRDSSGNLLSIQDKLPTLQSARDLLTLLKKEKREVVLTIKAD